MRCSGNIAGPVFKGRTFILRLCMEPYLQIVLTCTVLEQEALAGMKGSESDCCVSGKKIF
jgi:hypothetical protein